MCLDEDTKAQGYHLVDKRLEFQRVVWEPTVNETGKEGSVAGPEDSSVVT